MCSRRRSRHRNHGGLALENDSPQPGSTHNPGEIATTPVVTKMLGGTREGSSTRCRRPGSMDMARDLPQKAHTGPRKSWAAGDAASRGVRIALMAMKGEIGCPSALTAKTWGFYHVLFKDKPFKFQRPFGSYVIENVLFKIPYPTAFHGQSGVEAAIKLHPLVKDRLDDIKRVEVRCHNSSMVILDKSGPLHNFADRDHCMQYMMAVGMIFGTLTAEHYYDHIAADPRIDKLRARMHLAESKQYEKEYHDPAKRTNANSIQVYFNDGSKSPLSEVVYPLGHRRRRAEGIPVLMKKFRDQCRAGVRAKAARTPILEACLDQKRLAATPVNEFMDLLAV